MEIRLVTQESVHAACDSIVASGRKPSYRSIIDELGGGSPNDIKAHFASWKVRNEAASADVAEPEPPALPRLQDEAPALVSVLETLAASLLRTMAASADAMTAEYEEKLRTVQEGAEARLFQVRHEAEQAAKTVREQAAAEVAALHDTEAVLIEERDTLDARVRELEAGRDALSAVVADLKEANACLSQEQALERESLTGLGHQLAAAERNASAAEAKLKMELDRAGRLESEKATLLALVEGLRSDVTRERERNDALHSRVEELVAALAAAKAAA